MPKKRKSTQGPPRAEDNPEALEAARRLGPTSRKAGELARNTSYFHRLGDETHPVYNHMKSLLGEKKVGEVDLKKRVSGTRTLGDVLNPPPPREKTRLTRTRTRRERRADPNVGGGTDIHPVHASRHPVYSKMAELLGEARDDDEDPSTLRKGQIEQDEVDQDEAGRRGMPVEQYLHWRQAGWSPGSRKTYERRYGPWKPDKKK